MILRGKNQQEGYATYDTEREKWGVGNGTSLRTLATQSSGKNKTVGRDHFWVLCLRLHTSAAFPWSKFVSETIARRDFDEKMRRLPVGK